MHSKDANGMADRSDLYQSAPTKSEDPEQSASSLIWICTVWSNLSVQISRIFTVMHDRSCWPGDNSSLYRES